MNKSRVRSMERLAFVVSAFFLFFVLLYGSGVVQPGVAQAASTKIDTTFSGTYIGLGWDDGTTIDYNKSNIKEMSGKNDGKARKEYVFIDADNKKHNGKAFITLKKENAATYDGRSVNMKLEIDYVKFEKVGDGRANSKYVVVAARRANDFFIGSYNSDMKYGFKSGKKSRYNICGHVYFYWADTGNGWSSIANRPFIQCVEDIDEKNEDESWTGNSGYSEFFTFKDKSKLNQSSNTFTSKKDWDADNNKQNECLKQAGLYAATSSGNFWFTCHGGNCNTEISLGAQVTTAPATKYIKGGVSEVGVGDEVTWCIARKMPIFYKDTFSNYTKTVITDELDSKLEFVRSKSKVWLESKEITNQGDFACNNNVVTWTAGSGFLKERSNYSGKELRLELVTKTKSPGSLQNIGNVAYFEIRKSPGKILNIPATINYYRDYAAGDTTPCYVDKTTNTTSGYQVNSKADAAAKRSDCSGLDGWYTDSECTKKYDGSWIPSSTDYVLNLYSKNKVTLSYAATSDSWFNKHPNRSVFADKDLSDKLTDRTAGKTASGASILPTSKEAYYGDVITVDSGKSLWFESEIFGSGDKATRELKCSDGVYAYEDGSGDLLKEVRLTSNSTAYLKWLAGSYDGVYAAG